ncbi:MAG: hypothetical protein J0626_08880, partial [Rhodospirillaceae bacterium]|nr:hypothetical protein [Rhodospirillaceae bacterium]
MHETKKRVDSSMSDVEDSFFCVRGPGVAKPCPSNHKVISYRSFLSMSLGQQLAPHLPFLRRYARALTGSQNHGDAYVRAALEAIVDAPDQFPRDVDPRLGLYRTFQAIWSSANLDEQDLAESRGPEVPEAIAQARLAAVTPRSRQALLLTSMEGFSNEDAAYLIETTPGEVESLVGEALAEIERQTRADVLIIEDEPI